MRKVESLQKAPFPAPLTQDQVKAIFDYNPKTGDLIWKIERYRKHPGDVAGCKHVTKEKNYKRVTVSINYKRYLASRVIWLWVNGYWPENEIDHKDGDGWNNSWGNLREATHEENGKNLSLKKNNKTGVAGISMARNGKDYRARIMVNRKEILLGYFKDFDLAVKARKAAELKYFGAFAREAA